MAKYLVRTCPKCNGYLEIVIPERKAKMPMQAINGRCLKCGIGLRSWLWENGYSLSRLKLSFDFSTPKDVYRRRTFINAPRQLPTS